MGRVLSSGAEYYLKLIFPIMIQQKRSTGMSPFQIIYGMHPRGVCELCDLGQLENRSVDGEEFAKMISEIQEQVKARIQ